MALQFHIPRHLVIAIMWILFGRLSGISFFYPSQWRWFIDSEHRLFAKLVFVSSAQLWNKIDGENLKKEQKY